MNRDRDQYLKANPPIVILGAARSGTKILRAALDAHSDLRAIPYDINYVWLAGHQRRADDELSPHDVTRKSREFIRNYVAGFVPRPGSERVVEKTVSNSLRVEFVRDVFPEARFVEIVRDGRDVAASAREQWLARPRTRSLVSKLRTFPVRQAWRYGLDYTMARALHRLSGKGQAPIWGPRFLGIDEAVRERELIEVCAMQWARCVERCREALASLPDSASTSVSYEALAKEPVDTIKGVLEYLDLPWEASIEEFCRVNIVSANVGKWKDRLTTGEQSMVLEICGKAMAGAGYFD